MIDTRILWRALAAPAALSLLRPGQAQAPGVGRVAPPIQGRSTAGARNDLATYRGKRAVVVNFYQNHCGACRQEFPHLVALSKAYRTRGVQFLAVPLEPQKTAAAQWSKTYRVAAS